MQKIAVKDRIIGDGCNREYLQPTHARTQLDIVTYRFILTLHKNAVSDMHGPRASMSTHTPTIQYIVNILSDFN